jgi:RHS repeat-associated protein
MPLRLATFLLAAALKLLLFFDKLSLVRVCAGSHYSFLTEKERDIETGLDFFEARYYQSIQGRFTSADPVNTVIVEKLVDPQQLNLYQYTRNNPLVFVDPSGMTIVVSNDLTPEQRAQWDETVRLANLQDEQGNYVNPELHATYQRLQNDSRVFTIEAGDLGAGTAGRFEITAFSADGKDFTAATITLNFDVINKKDSPQDVNYDKSFKSFAGLLGKDKAAARVAEVFSHEGAHAEYAINNPAEAVKFQLLVNDVENMIARRRQFEHDKRAIKNKKQKKAFQPPPDLVEAEASFARLYEATERYAQTRAKAVNAELRQSTKKKKKK